MQIKPPQISAFNKHFDQHSWPARVLKINRMVRIRGSCISAARLVNELMQSMPPIKIAVEESSA